ncbi:MAG: helix-turn-helix domain-containing protein [Acidimicrobiia bacterium]
MAARLTFEAQPRVHHHQEITMDRREPLTVSVVDAAQLLGISRALAYDLVARGELPSLRLGRRVVIPRRALETLVEEPGTRRWSA